jgi:hypothetical protein
VSIQIGYRAPLKKAANRAAVISNDVLPLNSTYTTRLSTFFGYVLAFEFLTVAASAYFVSVFYYHFILGSFPRKNNTFPRRFSSRHCSPLCL